MDKTCSIVQDLLPLYEEDMLREETKEFVDGHLAQCAACRAELDALKADVKPAPVSAQPLRDLKRQLRRKKLTAVLLAVTLALTLATAGFAYLTAPQYLPYSETEWAISRSPSALADDGSAADGTANTVKPVSSLWKMISSTCPVPESPKLASSWLRSSAFSIHTCKSQSDFQC